MENTLNLRPPLWLPIVVALIAGGSYIHGKTIETRHMDRVTIDVSGEGRVFANPDIATLTFGVNTGRQKTAQDAMKSLALTMEEVIAGVKAEGVEEKDIRTQQLSVNPQYDWSDGERKERGYEAYQTLAVKVRDIDSVSSVLSAAIKAGANQNGGVGFTIDDPEELKMEARQKAIMNAQDKAQKLAASLGKSLGEMTSFYEDNYAHHQPYAVRSMAMDAEVAMEESFAPPIPSGEQEVSVKVNIGYELR